MSYDLEATPASCDHLSMGWCHNCYEAVWHQRLDLLQAATTALRMVRASGLTAEEDLRAAAKMEEMIELAKQGRLKSRQRLPSKKNTARETREWETISGVVDAYFDSDMPKVASADFDGHMQDLRALWRERLSEEETLR